jgi:hypothetical protein
MKKIILISILCLTILLLVGCGTNKSVDSTEGQAKFEEKKGILTDTIEFGEGEPFHGKVNKHKTSKKADIDAVFELADDEEEADFLGSQVFMAPMMVNMLCGFMDLAIFSPDELSEFTGENSPEKSDMWGHLEGYEVTEFSITVIDAEDKEKIAKCTSGIDDDIEFVTYRTYDPEKSMFGMEIGVFEE